VVWVRVTACTEDAVFSGTVLNQPQQLTSIGQGSVITFLVPNGYEYPLMVTEKYLKERAHWSVQPCQQCGLTELFDAPSDLVRAAFPDIPQGSVPEMFTTFCGACGGMQAVEFNEAGSTGENSNEPIENPETDDISSFHQNFYMTQDVDNVAYAMYALDNSDISLNSLLGPMTGFYAEVFRANPERLSGWVSEIETLSDRGQHLFTSALWQSGTPEAEEYLEKRMNTATGEDKAMLQAYLDHTPVDMRTMVPTDGVEADMLWGAFFSTGDPVFVRNLIAAATQYGNRDSCEIFAAAAVTKWSLVSNAEQHDLVLQILQSELSNHKGEERAIIQDMIDKSKLASGAAMIAEESGRIFDEKEQSGEWRE
jgi:hypothetical protein